MILATIKDGTRDGRLVAVSPDRKRYAPLSAGTLQHAIENWSETAAEVAALADFPEVIDAALLSAPLPRAWQWLDGSVFATHAELMQVAFGLDPIDTDRPLMYQGMSDVFHGAYVACPKSLLRFLGKAWNYVGSASFLASYTNGLCLISVARSKIESHKSSLMVCLASKSLIQN